MNCFIINRFSADDPSNNEKPIHTTHRSRLLPIIHSKQGEKTLRNDINFIDNSSIANQDTIK
jgi:hypothetical protein